MEISTTGVSYEEERHKPMPSKNHAKIQSRIVTELSVRYSLSYDILSELTLLLNGVEVVPDVCILPASVLKSENDELKVSDPPICTIEILSPTQSLQDLIDKASMYFHSGVRSFWLVIPALKNVYVFSDPITYQIFRENDVLVDVAVDISLELSAIFK